MRNWVSRFLAAIGGGRRKTEADVSYDPALDDNASGGDLEAGAPGRDPEHADPRPGGQ